MKQTLLKHKIQLIILSVILVIVSILSFVKVDYSLTAPGYNNDVSTFINVDIGYEAEGAFYTTSVISLKRSTILQKMIGDLEAKVNIRETPDYVHYTKPSDLKIMGSVYKNDSLATSLVAAIEKAGYSIAHNTYTTVYLTYTYLDEDTLQINDKILSINGRNPLDEVSNVVCDDTATFVVLRGEETMSFDVQKHTLNSGACSFGAFFKDFTEITSSSVRYTLSETNTGGNSGGLMQSLYIFNQLTPNDLTGGLKIGGTGAIDAYGNVGAIGGIEQKIITSVMNNIDVFFVPYLSDSEYDNYIEAIRVFETLESDMIIVPVQTIEDAIDYLESRFGGAFDE